MADLDKVAWAITTGQRTYHLTAEDGGGREGVLILVQKKPKIERPSGIAVADRTEVAGWQELTARSGAAPGTIGLFMPGGSDHNPTGAWLSAQPDGSLVFNRERPADWVPVDWEAFTLVDLGGGQYALQTWMGTLVVAEGGGGGAVRHRSPGTADGTPGPWETWTPSVALGRPVPAHNRRVPQGAIRRFGNMAVGDDNGPWLYAGLSRFYATGEVRRNKDRVLREMDLDVEAGYDYQRTMLQVDSMGSGDYWRGHECSHRWSDHESLVSQQLHEARQRRFLLECTLIGKGGGIDAGQHERIPYVRRMAAILRDYPDVVLVAEMMNEPGVGGNITREELLILEREFKAVAPNILTATGADWHGDGGTEWSEATWRQQGQIGIVHLDRDTSRSEMQDRPWRQPWDVGLQGRPWKNNEPIGPQSSVNGESRPLVLRSHAAVTYVCRGLGYVYHTDGGVRGITNAQDYPGYSEVPKARRFLPPDLCNSSPQNANANYPGRHWDIDLDQLRSQTGNRRGIIRGYGARQGRDQWTIPHGPVSDFEMRATRALRVRCFQQDVNDLLWDRQVGQGERVRFTAEHPDYLVQSTEV